MEIFNFDEIFRLYVDEWENEELTTESKCFCIRAEKSSDNMICAFLGEYKTEERAREVLQGIGIFYEKSKRNECSSNNGVAIFFEKTFVYEMPEK